MPRIRTIKPEFPQSESMGRVSRDARLLFILIWTIVDDEGRARADSRMLARVLYPYDDGEEGAVKTSRVDIERWLAELEDQECVIRYEVDGNTYLQICNWLNHQKIDKPSRSKIPQFDESSRKLSNPRERSSGDLDLDQGSGSGSGSGPVPGPGPVAAPRNGATLPVKVAKVDSPEKQLSRDIWTEYSTEYRNRYGTDPVRNAKVNGQISQIGKRLGAEAPAVAAFYVSHNNAWYVRICHGIDGLVKDAESLRTQWATNRQVTQSEANGADRTHGRMAGFDRLLIRDEHGKVI